MNKWIAIPIIGVLAAGLIAMGFLYQQETNKLKDAQFEIVTLEGNVSTLEADLADAEARVSALEAEASALVEAGLAPVTFPDANLEAAIREAISKPEGAIYISDLEPLTTLEAQEKGISDLTGLKYCVNLRQPRLFDNNISDISALAGLTNLWWLYLGDNNISAHWSHKKHRACRGCHGYNHTRYRIRYRWWSHKWQSY